MSDAPHSTATPPVSSGGRAVTVVTKTSDYTLTAADCDGFTIFCPGDNAVTFTLPSAAFGLLAKFVNNSAGKTMKVLSASGDVITTKDITDSPIVASNSRGAALELFAINDTSWVSQNEKGTMVMTPSKGFVFGGQLQTTGDWVETIDKFSISSGSAATTWGNTGGAVHTVKGYSTDDYSYVSVGNSQTFRRFATASESNAVSIGGSLGGPYYQGGENCQSSTHGFVTGGSLSGNYPQIWRFIFSDYTTSTNWATLSVGRIENVGASTFDYGFCACGYTGSVASNVIDRFPFASQTNASDWADTYVALYATAGCKSSTHGYILGGYAGAWVAHTSRFSLTSQTNGEDWGDLTQSLGRACGVSSVSSGYKAGGYIGPDTQRSNTIEKFSFASNSNAASWSTLTSSKSHSAGTQA